MKRIIIAAFFLLINSSCSSLQGINIIAKQDKQNTQQYLSATDDIPIMDRMKKNTEESAIGFDSKNGSIVSSSFHTDLTLSQIADFYNQTLPQLGWQVIKNQKKDHLVFHREKQVLTIEYSAAKPKNSNNESPENNVAFLLTNQL